MLERELGYTYPPLQVHLRMYKYYAGKSDVDIVKDLCYYWYTVNYDRDISRRIIMAERNAGVLLTEPLDRAWVKKSLESQRAMLVRSRGKEMVGSEVHELRGREIAQLDVLIQKVG